MDADDFQTQKLPSRALRRTYLVTYSRANMVMFPTRESFGTAVEDAFNRGTGKVKTEYWACSQEEHQDGGLHYHVSVKLTGPKRWGGEKKHFSDEHGIVLNFFEAHDDYYSAYKYITKSDKSVYESKDHPNLTELGFSYN